MTKTAQEIVDEVFDRYARGWGAVEQPDPAAAAGERGTGSDPGAGTVGGDAGGEPSAERRGGVAGQERTEREQVDVAGRPEPRVIASLLEDGEDGPRPAVELVGPMFLPRQVDNAPPVIGHARHVAVAAAGFLEGLKKDAAKVSALPDADARAVALVDLETRTEPELAKLAADLSSAETTLKGEAEAAGRRLLAPGDELPAAEAREIRAYFGSLDDAGRSRVLRMAEQRRDWRTLRAIAASPVAPYVGLDPVELNRRAGTLRDPALGQWQGYASTFADHVERNRRTLLEQAAGALERARAGTDASKVALVRQARGRNRVVPLRR